MILFPSYLGLEESYQKGVATFNKGDVRHRNFEDPGKNKGKTNLDNEHFCMSLFTGLMSYLKCAIDFLRIERVTICSQYLSILLCLEYVSHLLNLD